MSIAELQQPRKSHRVWWGTGVLLAQVLGTVLVAPRHAADSTQVMLAAAIGAAGTLLMAAVLAPLSRYPRWSYWTLAVLFATFMLATPALVATPQAWIESVRPQIWLLPWFFLTVASVSPRSRAFGVCAPQAPWSGPMLLGSGFIFFGLVAFAAMLSGGRH